MAKIKLRRGLAANIGSAELQAGEPAFTLDNGKLFIGDGTSKVLVNDAASRFASCPSAAAATEKAVSVDRFSLNPGEWLFVLFDNANSAENPALNVNGLGAKPIHYKNAPITADGLTSARLHMLVYDGAQFELVGDIDTAYSAIGLAELQGGTATAERVITAKVLSDWVASKVGTESGDIAGVGANGKIDPSIIPHQAVTDVFVCLSQAEMLALANAHPGDVCIRTDTSESFILQSAPASTLGNWVKFPVRALTASDVGLDDATLGEKIRSATVTKADLESPEFTGSPTAPTAAQGTSTGQLATTEFVTTAVDTIDGGVF
jgi:hypothetical protein